MTHDDLVHRAYKWLKSQGCGVAFHDGFIAATTNGEQPDAIGWRDGVSILIECKASRSDFHADKKKWCRQNPDKGMGMWRFYMCPPDVINVPDLPDGWGLLWVMPKMVKRVHGVPGNCDWGLKPPFVERSHSNEMRMMYSALRRMDIRGHLQDIYEGLPKKSNAA